MGEVWRADDLVLETPVALKLIYSTEPEGARAHPQRGPARPADYAPGGLPRVRRRRRRRAKSSTRWSWCDGEDLATLLRRMGRLPIGEGHRHRPAAVRRTGGRPRAGRPAPRSEARQRAHRRGRPGADHRLRHRGHARCAQIAPRRSARPATWRPSSSTPAASLSERTDIYALGLILYELLVGRPAYRPAAGRTASQPPKPSTLVPDVDPRLERVILKAMAHDPRDRPASVRRARPDLLVFAGEPAAAPSGSWAAGGGCSPSRSAVSALLFTSPRGRHLTEQDTIVLADFQNTTGEPVFDGALKVALAVALEQSPFLKVFPDDRARETLRLMQRPADERVTRDDRARDCAARAAEGARRRLDRQPRQPLRARARGDQRRDRRRDGARAGRGSGQGAGADVARRHHVEAARKARRIAGVDRRFDAPLPQATTARSRRCMRTRSRSITGESFPVSKRFRTSSGRSSSTRTSRWRRRSCRASTPTPAARLRRRSIRGGRSSCATGSASASASSSRGATTSTPSRRGTRRSTWHGRGPGPIRARRSRSTASGSRLAAFGQHEQAVAAFRGGHPPRPGVRSAHGNLAGSLIALNRFDEAKALVRRDSGRGGDAVERSADGLPARLPEERLAGAGARTGLARRTSACDVGVRRWKREHRRLPDARRRRTSCTSAAVRPPSASDSASSRRSGRWKMPKCTRSPASATTRDGRVAAGLALSRDNFTLERAGRALALCGER